MTPQKKIIVILAALSASVALALAEDIETISGRVYKHATVTRVEPDGIVIKFAGGIVKIPFTDLSRELQQRYDYDPEAAAKFHAENAAVVNAIIAGWSGKGGTTRSEAEEELLLRQIRIFAFVKPYGYGRNTPPQRFKNAPKTGRVRQHTILRGQRLENHTRA